MCISTSRHLACGLEREEAHVLQDFRSNLTANRPEMTVSKSSPCSEMGFSRSRFERGASCAGGLRLFRFAAGLVVGRGFGFLLAGVLSMMPPRLRTDLLRSGGYA